MTFREIPRDVLARMFECFRTRWRWDPASEQLIYEGFINVLKTRYSDIMRHLRITSTMMASRVREDMDPNNYLQFDIIRDYPPHSMSLEVWRALCRRWNTPGWLNKSKSGSRNRRSGNMNGKSSRHTGGSMGYAERRARMKRKMNAEPNFKQIFLETHLTKECKQKLWDGDIDIYNLKELKFCTKRAEKVYGDYLRAMEDVYGPNFSEYPDDPAVWARVIGEGHTRRVYGIGSSDLQYLMTGTCSSSAGSAPSQAEYQRSQEELKLCEPEWLILKLRFKKKGIYLYLVLKKKGIYLQLVLTMKGRQGKNFKNNFKIL
ncbi:putative transposase, Ptta/En/Spm, plant [Helianthus annuus]|nr:putative transposase, Ptta/En/Spm, plant [Helianthus annuus]KAJ0531318.1 putative transposase, Ptta/En/Spm, plant [Helianthus annuus]KAJ0698152.1 putative transposase, Ptta/En/Spm, plant [Helianthus annuus]KAJ0701519.1 putative transposase, Ptta/En/Spm, plant [Helianthus annuus]